MSRLKKNLRHFGYKDSTLLRRMYRKDIVIVSHSSDLS